MQAINSETYHIQNIKNPTEKVQLAAVRRDMRAFDLIKNPTDKVKALVAKLKAK